MKEIECIIDENGQCSIELFGWKGKGCADVAKKLSDALGQTVDAKKKDEYWKVETKQKTKICQK